MKGIERFHWTTFEWLYMAPENPYDGPYNHETHSLYEKFRDHHDEQEVIVDKKVFAKAEEIASRTEGLIFTNSMGGPAWGILCHSFQRMLKMPMMQLTNYTVM